MKKQRKTSMSKGRIIICAHTIEWSLEGKGLKLSDSDTTQITAMLVDNYVEGELYIIANNKEVKGYWSILI